MQTFLHRRWCTAPRTLAASCAVALLTVATAPVAGAQGVRFTLAPSAEYVWWDKTTGIEDGTLFGGRLGADFGSLFSLSGYYHRGSGFGVARDSLTSAGVPRVGLLRTSTGVSTYGGNVAMRLSSGRLAPFISGGAGIIRFEPDSVPRVEQINYRYGGGFHYDASPNIRAMVMLEDSRFRLAPGALFPAATGSITTADEQATRSNWTLSAGLGIAVGGTNNDDNREAERWSVGSIPVEPFVGRLSFDDSTMSRQALAGIRTGVDIGQYVGLRGFYWQGRSSDLKERQDMQSYGGEAQFNFTRSRGPSPFLTLGAGRIDYGEDYRDNLGRTREDETSLIVGAGVALRLADAFRLNIAVRDYVRGPQQLDSISSVDALTNNFMYTVGFGIDLGRSRSDARPSRDDRDDRYNDDDMRPRPRDRDAMRDRDGMRDRELRRMGDDARARRLARRDSLRDERQNVRRDSLPADRRVIMLPVPTVGELYVRYGDSTSMHSKMHPGGMPAMPGMPGMPAKPSDSTVVVRTLDPSDAMIQSLKARLDSLETRLRQLSQPAAPPARVAPARGRTPVVIERDTIRRVVEVEVNTETRTPSPGMQLQSVSPYLAGFDQLVIGVQADAGPIFGISALRLVPDLAVGFGDDPSMSLAVGAQYNFPLLKINAPGTYRPHARAGLGFLAASGSRDSEFGVNLAYGLTYGRAVATDGAAIDSKRPLVFVEHQGIDFFSTNRFLLGLRWATR